MIGGFKDKRLEALWDLKAAKGLPADVSRVTRRKLILIEAARSINDLRTPPGNRLEQLKDDRAGQYSLRVNDQWRICFTWRDGRAFDLELVDYH